MPSSTLPLFSSPAGRHRHISFVLVPLSFFFFVLSTCVLSTTATTSTSTSISKGQTLLLNEQRLIYSYGQYCEEKIRRIRRGRRCNRTVKILPREHRQTEFAQADRQTDTGIQTHSADGQTQCPVQCMAPLKCSLCSKFSAGVPSVMAALDRYRII